MTSLCQLALSCITVPFVFVGSLFVSLISAVIINGVIGLVVLIWRVLKLNTRVLVDFQSAVLATWFSIFMGHFERFGGLTIELTGDALRNNESALVICNHRSWIDTLVLYSLARQVKRHGDLKFLAKRSLLFFPVYGLAGAVLEAVIFITREASKAGRRMSKVFARLSDPGRENHPFWLIIYAEGTRLTNKKLQEAQDFAKKRDLPVLNHVLQPRTKGFVSTVQALRNDAKAVYDITIGYGEEQTEDVRPSFLGMHFTPSRKRVIHVHQRRIPLDSIPEDEEEAKKWLYKLYEQKDNLLEGYYKNKKFDGRPMRWNRMSMGYWMSCTSFYVCGALLFALACRKLVP